MRAKILQRAAELERAGIPFAFAVVVHRLPASSAREGDMAVVTADGGFEGWLGGSCTKPVVLREALQALAEGAPRLVVLAPDPESARREGVVVEPMTCHSGGSVEIYIDPVLPSPRLVVYGESPIATALARLGDSMGYRVETGGERTAPRSGSELFAVVCAMGEDDEGAITQAIALDAQYLGVVASAKRFAMVRETLLDRGLRTERLDTIRSPAGLRIGAKTPEEIALSVLAEIVERRRASMPAARQQPPAAATAIDPVCGMTVVIATAKHVAEHAGGSVYFCGAGCKARFLAAPETFALQGAT